MISVRLSVASALDLVLHANFLDLAERANKRSKELNQNRIAYFIDCNINYTNICCVNCSFCSFSRPQGHPEAWELSLNELDQKIGLAVKAGSTRILLQGGTHPNHTLTQYSQYHRRQKRALFVKL